MVTLNYYHLARSANLPEGLYIYYYYMNLVTLHKSLEKKRIVGAETGTRSVCESQFVKMILRRRSESFICLSGT